jgi:decaprenyl-phosphate phosphoribosyltransferase
MNKLINYIKLIRPHHYLKNLLIFTPLFFALKITNVELLTKTFVASIIFTIIAGVVYILNDYKDIEEDKLHLVKKARPLASGAISKTEAIIFGVTLFFIGFSGALLLGVQVFALCLVYFILNLGYSFGLKHIALIDVFIIAIGFIIRILVGAAVTGIPLSSWIVILVFLLAISVSLAKRRDDVIILEATGKRTRKSIDGYNEPFLNAMICVSFSVMLVAYILYTTLPDVVSKFHNDKLYITSMFVIFGIFRYLQLMFVEKKTGSPVEVLIKDRATQLNLVCWVITFGLLIYLFR